MIYIIRQSGTNFVKIGHTNREIKARIKEGITWSPVPLEILAEFDGDETLEKRLHNLLCQFNSEGGKEWFRLPDDMMDADFFKNALLLSKHLNATKERVVFPERRLVTADSKGLQFDTQRISHVSGWRLEKSHNNKCWQLRERGSRDNGRKRKTRYIGMINKFSRNEVEEHVKEATAETNSER